MTRLGRRSLFALPLALPIAGAAALTPAAPKAMAAWAAELTAPPVIEPKTIRIVIDASQVREKFATIAEAMHWLEREHAEQAQLAEWIGG